MTNYRVYKTEIRPNNKQISICRKSAGTRRYVWNWAIAQLVAARKGNEKLPSGMTLNKRLNQIKNKEFPWMSEVSSRIPLNVLTEDIPRSLAGYFAKRARFPKFKSKKSGKNSFRLRGQIHVKGNTIQLPRMGIVKLKESDWLPGDKKIKYATISERAGRWFVSVLVEEEIPVFKGKKDKHHTVGVDLGIKTLATVSDGQTFENPRALQKRLRKLRRLNQSLARKQKGSQNRKKAVGKLQKLHWRISNVRKNTLNLITTRLAKTKRYVGLEDLNVDGLRRNRKLARAISDVGFYEFRYQLLYKAAWYNCKIILADRFFPSSKTCSCCGQVYKNLVLGTQKWQCAGCSITHDRDMNAAKNLEKVAAGLAETKNACGEKSSDLSVGSSETSLSETGMKRKSKLIS